MTFLPMRLRTIGLIAGALAFATATTLAAPSPEVGAPGALALDVRGGDKLVLRPDGHALVGRVRVQCATDTVAEVVALAEQRSTRGRAVRVVETECGPLPTVVRLVLEPSRSHFQLETVRLRVEVTAGFLDSWSMVTIGPRDVEPTPPVVVGPAGG